MMNANGRGSSSLGPTDKSTLMKIIMSDHSNDNDNNDEYEMQKEVAKLVLKCRELLSLTDTRSAHEKVTISKSPTSSNGSFLSSRVHNTIKMDVPIANFFKCCVYSK